jgi:hypothetical protein
MQISSFPDYPQMLNSSFELTSADRVSDRRRSLFVDLILFVAITIGLSCHYPIAKAARLQQIDAPIPVLDFSLIQQRYDDIQPFRTTQRAVYDLLGAPTKYTMRGGDFSNWEPWVEHSHRHFGIRNDAEWFVWFDSNDEQRWVLVLIAENRVYHKRTNGF